MKLIFLLFFFFLLAVLISAKSTDTCFDAEDNCSDHENKCFKKRYQAESFSRCRRTCRLCVPPGYEDYFSASNETRQPHHRRRHTRSVSDDAKANNGDKCGDLGPDCLQYTNYCTNQYYVEFMMAHCPLSCGYCSTNFAQSVTSIGSNTCNDIVQECEELARIGFCESDEQPAAVKKALCARTCKLCNYTAGSISSDETTTSSTTTTTAPPAKRDFNLLGQDTGRFRRYNRVWPYGTAYGSYDRLSGGVCSDQYDQCDELLESTEEGVCEHRAGYILCRRSCGFCALRPSFPKYEGRNRLTILIPPRKNVERRFAPTRVPVALSGRAIVVGGPSRRGLLSRPTVRTFSKYPGIGSLLDSWEDNSNGGRRSDSWDSLSSEDSLDSLESLSSGGSWSSSSTWESNEDSWNSSSEDSLEARLRRLGYNQVPNPPINAPYHRRTPSNKPRNEPEKTPLKQPAAVIVINGKEYPLDSLPKRLEELLRPQKNDNGLIKRANVPTSSSQTEEAKHRVGHTRPPRRSHNVDGSQSRRDIDRNGQSEDRDELDRNGETPKNYWLKSKKGENKVEGNLAKALLSLKTGYGGQKKWSQAKNAGAGTNRRRLYRDKNGNLKLITASSEPEETREVGDGRGNYNAQLPNGLIDDGDDADERAKQEDVLQKIETNEGNEAETLIDSARDSHHGAENPHYRDENAHNEAENPHYRDENAHDEAENPFLEAENSNGRGENDFNQTVKPHAGTENHFNRSEKTDDEAENLLDRAGKAQGEAENILDDGEKAHEGAENPFDRIEKADSGAKNEIGSTEKLLNKGETTPEKTGNNIGEVENLLNDVGNANSEAQIIRLKRQSPFSPASEFTGDETKIHVSRAGRIELGATDKDFYFSIDEGAVPWHLPAKRVVENRS